LADRNGNWLRNRANEVDEVIFHHPLHFNPESRISKEFDGTRPKTVDHKPVANALDQIQALELQIRQLKEDAILELKEKLVAARRAVADLEKEIESLTGHAAPIGTIRIRRESIPDEDLKRKILEVFAANGTHGMNAKKIADAVGQAPIRVRDFLKKDPKMLKRQGQGAGTRFFLP